MNMNEKKPYWNSYVAGIGLGIVLLMAFILVGRGLGASGAMTRISTYTVSKIAPDLAGQNKYMKKYISQKKHPLDDFLVYMFIGVFIGGFVSGVGGNRVKFETIKGKNTTNKKRIILALAGGIVSALGARLARGCTSGQALTGGATLALGSWLFMFAVFAGGYALAYFLRREWI